MRDGKDPPPEGGYRALVETFPNGVLVLFDTDLRYRIVGPEVLTFSKRKANEMVGKTIHELFPEDTASQLEPKLNATLEGTECSFDIQFEGLVHHLETRPTTINGDQFGVLVTQEVTEERRTTDELARQNERLNEFANLVSHDLRNPLEVASAGLELAQADTDSEHFEQIEDALSRMDAIIDDVLTLARHGQPIDEFEQVSLATIATQSWLMVDTPDASIEVDSDTTISADLDRLQQLLENLFRNAVEHGGDDVTVHVGAIDGESGFFVADDGDGIPKEDRSTVLESGYSTTSDGTGFGLAIVEEIARAHGWETTLTNSTEGGVRVEFTGVDHH